MAETSPGRLSRFARVMHPAFHSPAAVHHAEPARIERVTGGWGGATARRGRAEPGKPARASARSTAAWRHSRQDCRTTSRCGRHHHNRDRPGRLGLVTVIPATVVVVDSLPQPRVLGVADVDHGGAGRRGTPGDLDLNPRLGLEVEQPAWGPYH